MSHPTMSLASLQGPLPKAIEFRFFFPASLCKTKIVVVVCKSQDLIPVQKKKAHGYHIAQDCNHGPAVGRLSDTVDSGVGWCKISTGPPFAGKRRSPKSWRHQQCPNLHPNLHCIHSSVFWLPILLDRDSVKLPLMVPQSLELLHMFP